MELQATAILLAAGRSQRMGFDKMFCRVEGREVFFLALDKLLAHPLIAEVVVVAGEGRARIEEGLATMTPPKPVRVVPGGETRAHSVAQGLAACKEAALVAIHDAARPFVTAKLITRVLEAAARHGAAAPALPLTDTVKRVQGEVVTATLPRSELAAVQTPQAFHREHFERALAAIPEADYPQMTDDCMVMERAGHPVYLVEGELANRKITTPADLERGAPRQRVGHGYDVHRLVTGRPLILGGVEVPNRKGLQGHSDADVLTHAVMDALLGAAALGDIGCHFPDSDPAYEGASSIALLEHCARLLNDEGYTVNNIDSVIVCQSPKLASFLPTMRRHLARALGVDAGAVSIKATTEEGLGFTGQGDGIAAHCVVILSR